MAIERSWLSPYNYVQNNPIMRVDPDGRLDGAMPPDDYGLDKNGNITLLRKTQDKTDRLIVLDDNGKETNNSIEVKLGILDNYRKNTVKATNGKDYTFEQYDITGDEKAKALFEFVANNTEVEWSLTGIGSKIGDKGKSILTTSHIKNSEIGGGYLKAYGYTIRKNSHSHPNHIYPSMADKNFAKSLNMKFPKATLDIYHKGNYFQYDKKGLLIEPTLTLPTIEVTPKHD